MLLDLFNCDVNSAENNFSFINFVRFTLIHNLIVGSSFFGGTTTNTFVSTFVLYSLDAARGGRNDAFTPRSAFYVNK